MIIFLHISSRIPWLFATERQCLPPNSSELLGHINPFSISCSVSIRNLQGKSSPIIRDQVNPNKHSGKSSLGKISKQKKYVSKFFASLKRLCLQ